MKEIQSFLGFVNFNRNFIKRYSEYAESLMRLMKNGETFAWNKEQDNAFNKLKNTYTEEDIFIFFNSAKSNRIEINRLDLVIKAYLLQPDS